MSRESPNRKSEAINYRSTRPMTVIRELRAARRPAPGGGRRSPSACDAVAELHTLGLRTAMLTGDNTVTARTVAAEAGIDEVIAEVVPSDKADVIRRLRDDGATVAMVGDGTLATADGVARARQSRAPTSVECDRDSRRNDAGNFTAARIRHQPPRPSVGPDGGRLGTRPARA